MGLSGLPCIRTYAVGYGQRQYIRPKRIRVGQDWNINGFSFNSHAIDWAVQRQWTYNIIIVERYFICCGLEKLLADDPLSYHTPGGLLSSEWLSNTAFAYVPVHYGARLRR